MSKLDRDILNLCLTGISQEIDRLEKGREKVLELIRDLTIEETRDKMQEAEHNRSRTNSITYPVVERKSLSAAARKRIAAAQKKRWAEFHTKSKKTGAKK